MMTGTTEANPRAVSIFAKTLYKELKLQGFGAREVISLAGELLGMVTSEVRTQADAEEE